MLRARVLVLVNSSWNITNFRMGLLQGLRDRGCEIVVAAPPGDEVAAIEAEGFRFTPLRLDPKGRNPFADVGTIAACMKIMRDVKPDLIMSYTVKPNVYGGLAARLVGIPILPNVAGLGAAFSGGRPLRLIATLLYRLALKKAPLVFFQNAEDRALFAEQGIVRRDRTEVLPGSGVDIVKFAPTALPDGVVRFGMIARLVGDKGVREYVQAARDVKKAWDCQFVLAGFLEPEHPGSVTRAEIEAWEEEGVLRYLGRLDDVRPALTDLHCLVLPSYYREGTPRSLLEAASMARPLITTDHPGCRDTVEPGVTGYLVPTRDAGALREAMDAFCALSDDARTKMGLAGRTFIEARFSQHFVIDAYAAAIQTHMKDRRR